MVPEVTPSNEFETGIVYEFRDTAVYVPTGVTDQVGVDVDNDRDAVRAADAVTRETPPGVVTFERDGRGATERAELWAALHDMIDFDEPLAWYEPRTRDCRRVRIPTCIAADGTAAMATFLATYGYDNSEIADALGVGSRTVSQYISDFRKGER